MSKIKRGREQYLDLQAMEVALQQSLVSDQIDWYFLGGVNH